MSNAERLALLLAAALVASCATNYAPPGYLPGPAVVPSFVKGAWVDARVIVDSREETISGELLAATSDSLWVLVPENRGHVVSRRGASGGLTFYEPESSHLLGGVALGTLGTLSNGWLLILTAPAWWITATVAAVADSHAAVRSIAYHASEDPAAVAAYARFPQGIPTGMDASYTRGPRQRP